MKIHLISIFPEIFESFIGTSLIAKSIEKGILDFDLVNPRDFCEDKHRQIDDEIYGGGVGMLIKAKPMIDAIESVINNISKDETFKIIMPAPTQAVWNQEKAHVCAKYDHLIFVSGRYEGIDYRFDKYLMDKYPDNFTKISLGQFVTLGGEMPALVMVESVVRLIPGVIKEEASRQEESYAIDANMNNIEHPQYTRPLDVYGYDVPEILLSGHHKNIEAWKKDNSLDLNDKKLDEKK